MQHHTLPRLHIANLNTNQLVLLGAAHHYLLYVLRKQVGDKVRVFNAISGEWLAVIDSVSKKQLVLCKCEQIRQAELVAARVVLAPALIKPTRFSWLLEKATELGVDAIYPLQAERSQVRAMAALKMDAIVTEAAEQCERLTIPYIASSQALATLINTQQDIEWVAADEVADGTVPLHTLAPSTKPRGLIIGPEGGWSPAERQLFVLHRIERVSLGPLILRSETAAIAGLVHMMLKVN